ncbi:sulfide/dihydroorotate dehydrogenase-like FAD/NAD-binding protein [Clostridium sp.]|uniref:sulfide/dihydroorotate dehydrogenase-like FAD/NAD-binding protein n=1 Tax=Clostridium sp. TaxID=1506 RepID=UPI002FCC0D33
MSYEPYNCIDCGSEYCPCHLAESGNCIQCSHLDGKDFCDCCNWNGVCIYQEFVQNNYSAKPGRKYHSCKILSKEKIEDGILILKIKVSDQLVSELVNPGAFVFVRRPDSNATFDTPICIMDANTDEEVLTLAIELKGLKTKSLDALSVGESLLVKGPFWNGILGLKSVLEIKNKVCLLIARGIGQAPMVPVMERLKQNGNKIIVIIDKNPFKKIFVSPALERCADEILECTTLLTGGIISEKCRKLLWETLSKEDISLVHCDSADILSYQIMKFVAAFDKNIHFSCCNNEKMCCGEGICGCCTIMNNDEKLRRLCKMQTEPKYVFEGRRLF